MKMEKMKDEEIVSAIIGKPVEQIKKEMIGRKEMFEKERELILLIAKHSKNNEDVIANLKTTISTLLSPFDSSKDIQLNILMHVIEMISSGKSKEISEQIKKFKE